VANGTRHRTTTPCRVQVISTSYLLTDPKIETLNPIRSFKARGALFLMSELSGRPHLVCATAGNFGQGII
jgi:threonine dehydratase